MGKETISRRTIISEFDIVRIRIVELKIIIPPIFLILLTLTLYACSPVEPAPPFTRLPEDAIVHSARVGTLPGNFDVSPSGAAVYRIPLAVPDGRNGVQPELALQYHSRAGNGLLGVGWQLTGLSVIHRCRPTLAQDGQVDNIDFDPSDRLCLDGQRLVVVQGDYGERGAEYRTEEDSFARILQTGDLDPARAPGGFIVYRRDGRILRYGTKQSSRVGGTRVRGDDYAGPLHSDGRVTYGWALDEIRDRSGNALRIFYRLIEGDQEQDWAIEHRPARIEYTYNTTGNPDRPGSAAQRRIEFVYDDRSDVIDRYTSGLHLRTTKRLQSIELYAPNPDEVELVGYYRLNYRDDSITGRSLLRDVRACDGAYVCKPPTQFEWTMGSNDFESLSTGLVYGRNDREAFVEEGLAEGVVHHPFFPVDVNGDGWDDLLYCRQISSDSFRWLVRFSQGNGFGPAQSTGLPRIPVTDDEDGPSCGDVTLKALHYDGDGQLDILLEEESSYSLWEWDGTSFELIRSPRPDLLPPSPVDTPYLADLDGNKLLDFVWSKQREDPFYHPEPWRYRLHNATVFDPPEDSRFRSFSPNDLVVFDYEGDGKSDLLELPREEAAAVGDAYNALFLQDELLRSKRTNLIPGSHRVHLDLNGDGLTDEVDLSAPDHPREPDVPMRVRLNTGRGFGPYYNGLSDESYPFLPFTSRHRNAVRADDFNHDGRGDFLVLRDTGEEPEATLFISNGQTFDAVPFPDPGVYWHFFNWSTTQVLDIDGDGLKDIIQLMVRESPYRLELRLWRHTGELPDLLKGITNGMGARTEIDIKSISDYAIRGFYAPGDDCEYPQRCIRSGVPVVYEYRLDNGTSFQSGPTTMNRYSLSYGDGRVDLEGRGFIGFRVRAEVERKTGAFMKTYYDVGTRINGRYPFASRPRREETEVSLASGVTHRAVTRYLYELRWSAASQVHSMKEKLTFRNEYPSLRHTRVERSYDAFGNLTRLETQVQGERLRGTYTTVTMEYDNRESEWLIGLRERREITSETRYQCEVGTPPRVSYPLCSETRTTHYDHDSLGRLAKIIVEPDEPRLQLTTKYHYDDFGLVERVEQENSPEDEATEHQVRSLEIGYDEEHIYPRRIENALGFNFWIGIHPALGVPLITVDPNEVETRIKYDGFGRQKSVQRADGSGYTIDRTGRGVLGALRMDVRYNNGRETQADYDRLGRPIRTRERAFDGRWATQVIGYDELWRMESMTRSAFSGEERSTFHYDYDHLDRLLQATYPDGTTETYQYRPFEVSPEHGPLEVHSWDRRGNHNYVELNINGQIGASIDVNDEGEAIRTLYRYAPFGLLERVTDADGNRTHLEYDRLGRRTLLNDPDSGERRFTYSGFGELIEETDPEHPEAPITYQRDRLGRIYRTTSFEGNTHYRWDTAVDDADRLNALGMLHWTRSPDGTRVEYTYDELARPVRVQAQIGEETFHTGYDYDAYGRPRMIHYPDRGPGPRIVVQRIYNDHGFLTNVQDAATGHTYWSARAGDAAGRLIHVQFGNNVETRRQYDPKTGRLAHLASQIQRVSTGRLPILELDQLQSVDYGYDNKGNLEKRHDLLSGLHETFHYDALDRLQRWTRETGTTHTTSFVYDILGNLTDRIRTSGPPSSRETFHETFVYGENGAGPHAVSRAHTVISGRVTDSRIYEYDANGRRFAGATGDIEYTIFDLPRTITREDRISEFQYDAFQRRVRKADADAETIYIGDLYERRRDGDETRHVFYVHGVQGPVAQIVRHEGSGSTETLYLHPDRLGSISMVTDEHGDVVERRRFTPFGRRMDEAGLPLDEAPPSDVKVGFTGHESDSELGLINMRGRMYDPVTSRFLTPDPIVQSPWFGQSYNRYAYVLNNPLKYVDPSGFQQTLNNIERPNPVEQAFLRKYSIVEQYCQNHPDECSRGITYYDFTDPVSEGDSGQHGHGEQTAGQNSKPYHGAKQDDDTREREEEDEFRTFEDLSGCTRCHLAAGPGSEVVGDPRDIRRRLATEAEVNALALLVGSILVPGVGEAADVSVLLDPKASQSEKEWAMASVLISAYTAGFGPDAGPAVRLSRAADDATSVASRTSRANFRKPPKHHIATARNATSQLRGGPWTPRFQRLFSRAGISLEHAKNLIRVQDHIGPHPEVYHRIVYARLWHATAGLTSRSVYRQALINELQLIRQEIRQPGSVLHRLVTRSNLPPNVR